MAKFHVIIPCAGSGSRFASNIPKQYHELLDKTVLDWTLQAFTNLNIINSISVVYSPTDNLIQKYIRNYPQINFLPVGGASRAESVQNGLEALAVSDNDWILVHDAARCCIDERDVLNMIQQLKDDIIGGVLAIAATDTIKRVDVGSLNIVETIDRSQIYLAQTPQMFRYSVLKKALQHSSLAAITDEASAVELLQLPVGIVVTKYPNFKITYQQDLELAKYILTQRKERQVC